MQLKQICKANEQSERSHLNTLNQLLSGTIPDMNQQQGQDTPQDTGNTQIAISNLTDKDICMDILMTEKYVSGTYDTTIFEFENSQVRDILNHIQKEEQQHGEAVFQYMNSKGMYPVQ